MLLKMFYKVLHLLGEITAYILGACYIYNHQEIKHGCQ